MSESKALFDIDFQTRVSGNSKIIMAIDRMSCPLPGQGAMQIKNGFEGIREWAKALPPECKTIFEEKVSLHIKKAVDIMKSEKAASGDS